jgi:hypothetical protein
MPGRTLALRAADRALDLMDEDERRPEDGQREGEHDQAHPQQAEGVCRA